jgi:hypothetical protein
MPSRPVAAISATSPVSNTLTVEMIPLSGK